MAKATQGLRCEGLHSLAVRHFNVALAVVSGIPLCEAVDVALNVKWSRALLILALTIARDDAMQDEGADAANGIACEQRWG